MTIDGYYDCSVNEYIEKVRRKYWKIYFDELKREKDIPDHLLPDLNSMERIGFSPDAAQEIKKKADSPETDQMSELLRLFDLCVKPIPGVRKVKIMYINFVHGQQISIIR